MGYIRNILEFFQRSYSVCFRMAVYMVVANNIGHGSWRSQRHGFEWFEPTSEKVQLKGRWMFFLKMGWACLSSHQYLGQT